MTHLLTAASVLVTLGAGAVYLGNIRRGGEPLAVASWLPWTLLLLVGARAAQPAAAAYILACAAMCAATVVLSLPHGGWKPDRLGWACLAGAAAGLVLLLAVRSADAATTLTVAVDAAAYIPTAVHAWKAPWEEPWTAFAGWGAGAALTLATGHLTVLTEVAYPAYLLTADTAVAVMILARRRAGRSRVAQLAEQPAVNRQVSSSNLGSGARRRKPLHG